ncbi:MAG: hypothetical protein KAV87_09655 [Desulfobacteraceae bacterium]|nr:hypothetical protein [Desulfobacteraceae bacterium]
MDGNNKKFSKKSLQKPINKQEYLWQKLKILAVEVRHGVVKCEIKISDGKIVEIRAQETIKILRAD